ncbi:MAG: hypothetical protein M3Z56_03300 [Bacteroidota bacterium]|nr:hypothetical protein [Bacteroidota bacterium]
MITVEEQIKTINTKLQVFFKKFAALQKENAALAREVDEYRINEKITAEKMNLLELEASILKASAGKMNETERNGFEKQINQYVKDIEKCMAILNK